MEATIDASFYVDETGHTGIDLTNGAQPVFVAGGYLVREQIRGVAEQVVANALHEYRTSTRHAHAELKSSSLLGSSRGRLLLAKVLGELERVGAQPILTVLEKRFSLGGRFVDEFLDFADNPRVGPEFCTDRDLKRSAATIIGKSSEQTLLSIESALRNPSRDSRVLAVTAVWQELVSRGEHDLAFAVEGALLSPSACQVREAHGLDFASPSSGYAPNPTSLISILVAADRLALRQGQRRVALIHDKTQHYEESLIHAFRMSADPVFHSQLASVPFLEWFPRVERILPPLFVASESELLVQAADLLVGGIAHWVKLGMRGDRLDPPTRTIAECTLTVLADEIGRAHV